MEPNKCQIDHIFQDFLEPYKKSTLVILNLPITESKSVLNYVTTPSKLSVKHISSDKINQVLRSGVYGLGELKDENVSVVVFSTEKQAKDAFDEVSGTVIRVQTGNGTDIHELVAFLTCSSAEKRRKKGDLTNISKKLSRFLSDLQDQSKSRSNHGNTVESTDSFMIISDFQESEVNSLFSLLHDSNFHIRYQKSVDNGKTTDYYKYGVCKKWEDNVHKTVETNYPDLNVQLVSESCSLRSIKDNLVCNEWLISNESGKRDFDRNVKFLENETGCDIIFGVSKESKLDQIFGVKDENSISCRVLIHGVTDGFDLEKALNEVIKIKQKIETGTGEKVVTEVEPEKIESEKVETEKIEIENIETENFETENLETENLETANLETENFETISVKSDQSEERDMISKGEQMMNLLSQSVKNTGTSKTSAIPDEKIIKQKLTRITDLNTVLTAILSLSDPKGPNVRQSDRMRYFIPATEMKGEPRYLRKTFVELLDNMELILKKQLEVVKSGGSLEANFSVEEASTGKRLDTWHEKFFTQKFVKEMYKRKEMINETALGLILNEYDSSFSHAGTGLLEIPENSSTDLTNTTVEKRVETRKHKRLVTKSWAAKVKKDEQLLDDMIEIWKRMEDLKATNLPLSNRFVHKVRKHAVTFGEKNSIIDEKIVNKVQARDHRRRCKWGSNRWISLKLRCKYYIEDEPIGASLLITIPELLENNTMIERYHKELLNFDLFLRHADLFGKQLFHMFERAGLQKHSLIINSIIIDSDEDEKLDKQNKPANVRDLFDDAIETSQAQGSLLQDDFSTPFEPHEAFDFYTWDNEDDIRKQVLEKRRTGEFACFQSDMQAGRNYAKQLWDLIPKGEKIKYINYYKLVRDPFRKYTWLKSQGRNVRHIDLGYSKVVPFRHRSDTWFRKYKGFEIDPAVEKLARDALKNLGSINFSGSQFYELPPPVQMVAPLQMSLPPFNPSIGQNLEKRFIVGRGASSVGGVQAVYVPAKQTHEGVPLMLTPQQQNEQNESEKMFKNASLLGKYTPPSVKSVSQPIEQNSVPVSATFEKAPQSSSQPSQSAWGSLNWSNAGKAAKISTAPNPEPKTIDQPISNSYNPVIQQPISQAMKQTQNPTYPPDILLSYIKPACESNSAKVATKFIKMYQQQHHCHYLQHKIFYKSPNGGITSNFTNSNLLSIHSERFKKLFTLRNQTTVISLPAELDSIGVTTIIDYSHGFQLQTPPRPSLLGDLYSCAFYFQISDLVELMKRRFGSNRLMFEKIESWVVRLPDPKFLEKGSELTSVSQL